MFAQTLTGVFVFCKQTRRYELQVVTGCAVIYATAKLGQRDGGEGGDRLPVNDNPPTSIALILREPGSRLTILVRPHSMPTSLI